MSHFSLSSKRGRNTAGSLLFSVIVGLAILVQPVFAQAQDTQDDWVWRASIYGWLPGVSGSSNFPTGGGGSPDTEVDVSQILDNLKFTLMGSLKVRKGSWGVFTDVLYLDVGDTKKDSRDFTVGPGDLPAGVSAKIDFDLKSLLWTMAGTYNLSSSPRHEADLLFGARLVDMKQTLDYTIDGDIGDLPLPGRTGGGKITATNWDALVGVTGHFVVGDSNRWFIPYLLDVGTGDSDLTWQAMAGVGYKFGWGAMELTYRYLDYNMSSHSPLKEISFAGPLFGATFQW